MYNKKSKYIAMSIITLAALMVVFCIIKNPYFIIAYFVFFIAALSNSLDFKYRLILSGIYTLIGFSTILLIDFLGFNSNIYNNTDDDKAFLFSFIITSLILIIPFALIYSYYAQLIHTIENKRDYKKIIENSPSLVCGEHHTKTIEYSILGYKGITCRLSNECLSHSKILLAGQIIGLIGDLNNGSVLNNDYYITLWDHKKKKIRFGDFDIIEIHENTEINDYDFIISKVITFFNNEINRFKPLNEVIIRIIGVVDISTNTKILMQKHFQKIEYTSKN